MYPNPSAPRQPPPMYETVVQQGYQPVHHQQQYGPPQQVQGIVICN
jgi:hypothetical protein